MATTAYSVRTTVVYGARGQYQVTDNTSNSSGSAAGGWSASDAVQGRADDVKQVGALQSAGDRGSSRYTSGWGSRYSINSSSSSGSYAAMRGKSFDEVKAQCIREKKLFEDPDFPALDSSIFYSRSPPRPFVWQRPTVSYFDISF